MGGVQIRTRKLNRMNMLVNFVKKRICILQLGTTIMAQNACTVESTAENWRLTSSLALSTTNALGIWFLINSRYSAFEIKSR